MWQGVGVGQAGPMEYSPAPSRRPVDREGDRAHWRGGESQQRAKVIGLTGAGEKANSELRYAKVSEVACRSQGNAGDATQPWAVTLEKKDLETISQWRSHVSGWWWPRWGGVWASQCADHAAQAGGAGHLHQAGNAGSRGLDCPTSPTHR